MRALQGEEVSAISRVQIADDHQIWIQVSASPIHDEHGEIIGAVAASGT